MAFFVRNMLFSSNQCRMHFEKIVCKIPKIFTWSFLLMHAFAFGNYYFLTVIGAACYMCEQGRRNQGCRGAQFCYWYRNKPVSTKYFVLLSVPLDFQIFLRHWLGFAASAAVAKALNTDCPVKICEFFIYIVQTVIQILTYIKHFLRVFRSLNEIIQLTLDVNAF